MAVFWIIMIIEIMLYTLAANGQCASSTNIVPVCTNSTDSYTQMNIPVNGGMGDGCQCDVTLVETPTSGINSVTVSNVEDVKECGYKVVNYNTLNNDSWTCSNSEIFLYPLSLNKSFQLTFTRDSTPEPTSTGFCLHITTTIINIDTNASFTIICWRSDTTTSATISTASTPQMTIEQTRPPPTTNFKITSRKSTTSVSKVAPDGGSTDRTPVSGMTSIYRSTEQASTPNNGLSAGIAVGVSFGFLVLIIIIVILICIIRRKDKLLDEYVSRSDVNHPNNMYDVMTPREDNHHYEMSPARDSNATTDDVQSTYDVMVNRSPKNNYQTLAQPVNNGVYVNQ
ncbi:uncharacterized protein LOC126830407 isoform X2 [Patella vulgata]|uniref:uncharacterized protein LOC126830407 isoform X2 n=1 Tax=Patella vulgata TaxID=6465 RepID=UPI0024A96CAC|nr:uncharacterized protein LOC126830407 isoform X2 [Patella vulgata]